MIAACLFNSNLLTITMLDRQVLMVVSSQEYFQLKELSNPSYFIYSYDTQTILARWTPCYILCIKLHFPSIEK